MNRLNVDEVQPADALDQPQSTACEHWAYAKSRLRVLLDAAN